MEVTTVPVQERSIDHVVISIQVDIRAVGHRPISMLAQKEGLPFVTEELALKTLSRSIRARRGQEVMLTVLLGDHVLMARGVPVGERFPPRGLGYQRHDAVPMGLRGGLLPSRIWDLWNAYVKLWTSV